MTLTAPLMIVRAADAQALRGAAELQYQNAESASLPQAQESWIKNLRLDYARHLPASLELSSHFTFTELTIAGRPDRARTPQGTLQLAHPFFGLLTSYRPAEVRDAQSRTTRQQELSLTAYVQKRGLPQLTGSWIRRHSDPNSASPASTSVTRTVSGIYNLGNTSFRAGYGDQYQDIQAGFGRRSGEDHYNLGSSTQFRIRRAGVSLNYDFSQSRSNQSASRSQISRVHSAGVNSGLQFSERTSSSLTYAFRRTETVQAGVAPIDEHVGALSLSHRLSPGIDVSGGGGVRSATLNGRPETESYVIASATAEGEARPGWHLGAGASHSLNWLPGTSARPVDSFRSNTRMRLAPGLDATGDLLISAARNPAVAPETKSRSELSLQAGAGINTHPLRTLFFDATVNRYRAGPSLVRGGSSTVSYTTNLRLRPSNRLQVNGIWGLTNGLGSRSTTLQSSVQWSPNPSLQVSGGYSRTRQERRDPTASATIGQENYSGSIVMALARALSGTFRYTETNPGQVTHVRQLNASLIQAFGR